MCCNLLPIAGGAGLQCRFLWLMNQLLICLVSSPVDSANASFSCSWNARTYGAISAFIEAPTKIRNDLHACMHELKVRT